MEEKITMEDKIFDFAKTRDALGQLSTSLIELESSIKIRNSQLVAEKEKNKTVLAEKEQKITELKNITQIALNKIENINNYIDEVL